jgi:hypothetical protein
VREGPRLGLFQPQGTEGSYDFLSGSEEILPLQLQEPGELRLTDEVNGLWSLSAGSTPKADHPGAA